MFKKTSLINLSILILLLHPIAYAESNGLPQDSKQQQAVIQQLQTQIMNANSKIAVLETAMHTTNQDINTLRNHKALEFSRRMQQDATNIIIRRAANGHGR